MSSKPTIITDEARAGAHIPGSTIVGINVVYIVLTTVFTALRMYTRFSVHQKLWWDDWTTVVAWAGTVAFCAIATEMKDHGGGIDVWLVPDDELKIFTRHYQDVQMVARTSIFFAKFAILLLYIRIFYPRGTYRTALWWVIQAVIWLNLLYTVSLILAISLQCVPAHKPYGSSCANQYAILLSASTINTISDILVLIIPMGSLWRLRMSRNKKLSVWALFAFGALAPVFSVARLVYQVMQASGDNRTVIAEIVLLLALAEQVVSVVTGCMPVVSVWFIKRVLKRNSSAKPSKDPNMTLTQRFWPDRESDGGGGGGGYKRSWPSHPKRKPPSNPYSLGTLREDGTMVSQDGLVDEEIKIESRTRVADASRCSSSGGSGGGGGGLSPFPRTPPPIVVNVVSTSSVTRSESTHNVRGKPQPVHKVEVRATKTDDNKKYQCLG